MRTSSLLEKSAFIYLVTCMFFSTMNLFIVEVPSSIWELVLPIKIYLLILPVLFLSTLWIYRSRYSSQFRKLISAVFVAHVLGIYTDFYLLIFTDRPWLFFFQYISVLCFCVGRPGKLVVHSFFRSAVNCGFGTCYLAGRNNLYMVRIIHSVFLRQN